MKLILYDSNGQMPHHKNFAAIQRMCKSKNITLEISNSLQRITIGDYDILMTCFQYIPIERIPKHIKIIMGPQFFDLFGIHRSPINGVKNSDFSKRCVYNTLSKWNTDIMYEFSNEFTIPLHELPFSIDTEYFKPNNSEKIYDCIVYIKRRSPILVNHTLQQLQQKNLRYKIFTYGSYNENDYIDALQKSKFMITLDAHESQGFALEEAMSCGVPLLVFDATSMYDEINQHGSTTYEPFRPKNLFATSVPYWSDECGIKITDVNDIGKSINIMLDSYSTFQPRNYILQELSDTVCMDRILRYFQFDNDLFIITSVIDTGNTPWNYYPTRSLFDPEQRFQQTLETIASVRKYSPTSKILFVEGGVLTNVQQEKISSLCEYFSYLGEDEDTKQNCLQSNSKGLGDSWLIYKGIEYIKKNNIYARNLYKLSGRYCLNENYNVESISTDLPTFKKVNDDCHITFLFSIPYKLIDTFEKNITNVIHELKKNGFISMEDIFPKKFEKKYIVETIGAEGIIAIDKSFTVYKV